MPGRSQQGHPVTPDTFGVLHAGRLDSGTPVRVHPPFVPLIPLARRAAPPTPVPPATAPTPAGPERQRGPRTAHRQTAPPAHHAHGSPCTPSETPPEPPEPSPRVPPRTHWGATTPTTSSSPGPT